MKESAYKNERIQKPLLAILASILFVQVAFAQKSKLVESGVISGVPYASTQFENINMTNGNLNLNFPLAGLSGRGGISHAYQLRYSSKLWKTVTNPVHNPFWTPNPTYQNFLAEGDDAGWKDYDGYDLQIWNRMSGMDIPQGNHCDSGFVWMTAYRWKVEMVTPDGRKIEFRPIGYSDMPPGQSDSVGYFNVSPTGAISSVVGPGGACYVVESTPSGAQMTYYSTDGSGIRLTFANSEQLGFSWEMSMPDGSRIIQTSGGQKITDRNGNYIEQTVVTLPDSSQAPGWVDQFGRWIARKKDFQTNEDRYYQLGFNGELLTWKVFWKNVYVLRDYTTTCNTGCGTQRGPVIDAQAQMDFRVIDRIELPQQLGSLDYGFEYHAKEVDDSNISPGWGEIKSITMPTGAKVSYGYKLSGLATEDEDDEPLVWDFTLRADMVIERAGTINKKVLDYTETYDGQPEVKQDIWRYSIGRSGSSVTGPDGGTSTQVYWDIKNDEVKGGQVCKEIKPDGTIIERNWANNVPVGATYGSLNHLNAFVNFEVTTVPDASGNPALSKVTDYYHDQNGNILYTAEYDWVPASSSAIQRDGNGYVTGFSGLTPVRRSHLSYANSTPEFGNSTASENAYYFSTAPAFRNLVSNSEVQDGSGTPKTRSEITYDHTTFSTNTIGGNVTGTKVWDSFKGGQTRAYSNPLTSTNSISTSTTYNSYGMPLTTTDANDVVTTVTYGCIDGNTSCSGTLSNLYPTKTEAASNYSTLKRTTTAIYDFYTGLVESTTDVDNGLTNAMEYDGLGRPKKEVTAQGTSLESWTVTDYHDADRFVVVKSDLETKGDGKKIATQFYDQLGRVRLSKTLEDAATQSATNETDGIKVQTRYKSTGSLCSWDNDSGPDEICSAQLVSNPYRASASSGAGGEPTMGWTLTQTQNNGLWSETQSFSGAALPDPFATSSPNTTSTGIVKTKIDANATTVTDQASKVRRSITNGIGQLIRVDEPNGSNVLGDVGSPNQPTAYTYDTLNNLLTVTQAGSGETQCGPGNTGSCSQTRTFTYSTLSRLLSAANPESGTINYVYDSNGNLTTKTDARSIATTYTYDALNRVTDRDYSDATPDVDYTYGTTAPKIGKLIKVTNGTGADRSTTEYTAFDILGRVTASKQTTDGVTYGNGTTDSLMTYTYNLSGSLIEQQYPSGRVVKNTLDSTGDLAQVHSKKNASDIFHEYANSFVYTAAGAVSSLRLGNGKFENTLFNSRLQPTQIGLGASASTQNLLKLNYDYGTTANNGNVQSQTITVPTVGSNSGFTATQTYTYDSLNRIHDATENITGVTQPSWKQTFTYDRYGNRNFDEANTTTLTKSCGTSPSFTVCAADRKRENPEILTADNRIKGDQDGDLVADYVFDTAGNTTKDADARTFIYDAENKQVEVKNSSNATIGQYFYDGDGKRIKKVVPSTGETTIFVYDAAGKLAAEYSTIVASTNDAKVAYLTNDHLGSPRINTDKNGAVTARHDYHPFGEEVATSQRTSGLDYTDDTVRKQFTGYERDNETELDFAQARMYGGGHGRFSTPDPYNVILEKERGEDEDERADILIGFISNPQRWNMYVYVVNNPLAFTDPDGQKPRTINVFLDAGVLSKEGLEEWQKWAASAQAKDKELTINIYQISKDTPGTVNAFLESLKAKDTATIFMGHSTSSNGQRLGIHFNTGGDIGRRGGGLSKTADGVQIQNAVLAIFSCGFGNGFDNITSPSGTAFVSIVQGPEPTTRSDATNAAAFRFAKSIAAGSWEPLRLPGELNVAVAQGQSGINAYPSPDRPSVMAGDHVNYRILPPPRKRR